MECVVGLINDGRDEGQRNVDRSAKCSSLE